MRGLSRRQIIASAIASLPMLAGGRAFAVPAAAGNRFLLVFLRGGYDATNIVTPSTNSFYQEARPTISLAAPNPSDPDAALPLDADWSLHPTLKESIFPLWEARQIAFVPFAGTDDMSRSHFETQDTIELGRAQGGARNSQSGFLGRLAHVLARGDRSTTRPIAFTHQLPLSFRGTTMVPNIALNQASSKPHLNPRQQGLIEQMYAGQVASGIDVEAAVAQGFEVQEQAFDTIQSEMKKSGRGAVSASGFELTARRIGRLMRDQFNLAFVDVGGWDTHVNQGGTQGNLARRIEALGRGLTGFADEIGPRAWSATTVVVVSEFGRTFRENGAKGTDHGHGSTYWVLGGGINGGRIAGPQVKLAPETLNQGRDLPVLTDYRSLIGGILARQFGLSDAQIDQVFPGAVKQDLQIL